MSPGQRIHSGFSLIELLIALAVAAILLAVAAPDFGDLVRSTRQGVIPQRLGKTLASARDRAIMTNAPVSVCASEDGASCTGTPWQLGWIVFDDVANNAVVDPTETILSVSAALEEGISVLADGAEDALTYLPDGTTRVAGGFSVCDGRGPSAAHSLCIARTGLVRPDELGCDGLPIGCP